MAATQKFKGDDFELKMEASASPIHDSIEAQLDAFFDDAYFAMPLGDVIYESNRSPLANAIDQEIFRQSFPEIFTAFTVAGSFDSYLTVFQKIFGETVQVDFTVPDPGKLTIDIIADEVELSNFVARNIENNDYVYSRMITQDGVDNIMFQSIKGFKTQYELEQMLYEMVPAGIYTVISLELA
jgi:hypothetical protein